MKIALALCVLLCAVALVNASEMRLIKAKNGKTITMQKLAKELNKYDLVFFGEFHDNATIHQMQRELLPLIDSKRELILSFEMFERDVQSVLDAYLSGKIDEAEFIEKARPWGNYASDYRPLIEFAKDHKMKAIAANVPRYLAGKLARQGMTFKDDLEPKELSWMAQKLRAPEDEYRKAFIQTMNLADSAPHGMMDTTMNLENMYQAQCLKDETMAESIVLAITKVAHARIIHFNGDFHSRNFLGTVSRVQAALPKLKIAVISPLFCADWQKCSIDKQDRDSGTYLILLPEASSGGEE